MSEQVKQEDAITSVADAAENSASENAGKTEDKAIKTVNEMAVEKLKSELPLALKFNEQKFLAEPVIKYLSKRCMEDNGLAEDVMQKHKSWHMCFKYIVSKAKELLGGKNGPVEDEAVYEWAEDYYHKDDKADAEKKAALASKAPKTTEKKPNGKNQVTKTNDKKREKKSDSGKAEAKGKEAPEKAAEKPERSSGSREKKETNKKPDKTSMSGQMSLFDLM